MNEISIFENPTFGQVRSLTIDNEPWFVGKDVAEVLGYSDTNKAVSMHVDDEDKKFNDKSSLSFGQRGATLINESGLYALIFSSKLETAKAFKRWVTSEVLPAIRKTGCYQMPAPVQAFPAGSLAAAISDIGDTAAAIEKINAAMKAAANESFGYTEEPLVSSDVVGMRFGSLFDATQTMVTKISEGLYQVQVVSWYDNENSYTSQMVRTIKYFAEKC